MLSRSSRLVGRQVHREHPAGDEPVEAHADGGEVLFYRGLGHPGAERLDIGGDVERLDVDELADLVTVDPGKELRHGPVIGHAGVLVADGGGEEFQEPSRGMVAGAGDHRRHGDAARRLDGQLAGSNRDVIFRAICD